MSYRLPLVLALCLIGAPCHASVVLQLTPASQSVDLGGELSISIAIFGLDTSTALGGYDLNLGFDADLLTFRGIRFGDPVLGDQLDLDGSATNEPSAVMTAPGRLNLLEVSLDQAADLYQRQADAFLLATLVFDTLATGRSAITLAINDLADPWGQEFRATAESADVAIVPLPATALLLASGLWPWFAKIRSHRTARA